MKNNTIYARQMLGILVGAFVASGLLTVPRIAVETAGHAVWIIAMIPMILPVISVLLIDRIFSYYPESGIGDILDHIFGKKIKTLLLIFIATIFTIYAACSLRLFSEIINVFMLAHTPNLVILAIYCFVIWYLSIPGARFIGQFCEISMYLLFLALALLLPALSTADPINLFPIAGETDWSQSYRLLEVIPEFTGTLLLFIFYPYVTDRKKRKKYALLSVLISAACYLFIILMTLLVFGNAEINNRLSHFLMLYKITNIPVIERLDLLFLILWAILAVRPSISYTFAIGQLECQALGKRKESRKWLHAIITGTFFILAALSTDIQIPYAFFTFLGYLFPVTGILLPACILAGILIKNRKSAQKCQKHV